jgi:thymidylate synthase (FAD)
VKLSLIAKTTLTPAGVAISRSGRPDQGVGSDAEVLSEIAGRSCYDSWGTGRNSSDYHKHIVEVEHGSVLAHANFTFQIENVSRNLGLELIRHHVGTAVSQRSTRYCDESGSLTVLHPLTKQVLFSSELFDEEVVDVSRLKKLIEEADATARRAYDLGVELFQSYGAARGMNKFTARKQARGAMARHLPNGLETEIIWTMNVRAARNVIEQRANPAADAEIRQLGMGFFEILSVDSPALFGDYTPVPSEDGLGDGLMTKHRKI